MTTGILISHYRNPHGVGLPDSCSHTVTHRNLSCGDAVTLGWRIENGLIADIGYAIEGCMMHKASASILCHALKGRSVAETGRLIGLVRDLCDQSLPLPEGLADDLAALADIRHYPTRRNCVLLSWEALQELASAFSKTPAVSRPTPR